MSSDEPKVEVIEAEVSEERANKIKEEQKRQEKKTMLMQAELTALSPSSMLFNALNIASTELARLNRLSAAGELTAADFKKYMILIQSLVKLSEESRLSKAQSHLEGLTEAQKLQRVREALEVLDDE